MDTIIDDTYADQVAECAPMVRALCRSRVGFDSEDLAQDVMVRALQARGRGVPPHRVRAYLRTITRNLVIDRLRARAHRTVQPLPECAALEREVGEDDASTAMRCALRRLPVDQRIALLAFHVDGRSYDDIAGELGVTVAAVGHRLTRGRRRLRELLACCARCLES